MTRPTTLTDEVLRDALVEEPRPELAFEVADHIGERIRAIPQQRRTPLSTLGWPWMGSGDQAGTRLLRVAVLAMLAVGTVLALLALGAQPAPRLPANGLIVVGSDRAGLFVADPQSGETSRIVSPWTANPSGRTNRSDLIAISPDGDRLAFVVAGIDTWVIRIVELPSGRAVGEIVDDGSGVLPEWAIHWSRDGSRLLVEATAQGLPRIVAADPVAGTLLDVGAATMRSRDVATSPVDGRVAFVETTSAFGDDYGLVIGNPDSGAISRLAATTADGSTAAAPAWAPDGRSLAMTITRPDGTSAIARINADGSDFAVVTDWTERWPMARWSPDGSRLLVAITPQGGREADIYTNDDQRAELFLVQGDGSGWRRLADRACGNASWSPDGILVAYERGSCERPLGPAELRVVGADGSGDRAIWSGDASATGRLSLAWQALP